MGETKESAKKNPLVKWFWIHLIVVATLIVGMFTLTKMSRERASGADTVVYIVRHAEKNTSENAGPDPALTDAGQNRALVLAEILRGNNITHVYSSDYIRTRDTAAPTAKNAGVPVVLYDPRDLRALAERIKQQNGRYLVVGHSNTIRETVQALGAIITDLPVYEKSEYDRFYQVLLVPGRQTTVRLRRYGQRYVPTTLADE